MKNKEIKFRMPIKNLDGSFNEWFYWGFAGDNDEFISPHSKYRECESFQFTGVLDKNGKEIFEGDMIMGELDEAVKERRKTIAEIPRIYFERWVSTSGEIVGNIYEKP